MREESQAPRNSRELAVRNQFFTPRYVVQFLTDNTLGRIWLEMRRRRDTALADRCEYLVRSADETWSTRARRRTRATFAFSTPPAAPATSCSTASTSCCAFTRRLGPTRDPRKAG